MPGVYEKQGNQCVEAEVGRRRVVGVEVQSKWGTGVSSHIGSYCE